jgi:hypothetical protein
VGLISVRDLQPVKLNSALFAQLLSDNSTRPAQGILDSHFAAAADLKLGQFQQQKLLALSI